MLNSLRRFIPDLTIQLDHPPVEKEVATDRIGYVIFTDKKGSPESHSSDPLVGHKMPILKFRICAGYGCSLAGFRQLPTTFSQTLWAVSNCI